MKVIIFPYPRLIYVIKTLASRGTNHTQISLLACSDIAYLTIFIAAIYFQPFTNELNKESSAAYFKEQNYQISLTDTIKIHQFANTPFYNVSSSVGCRQWGSKSAL